MKRTMDNMLSSNNTTPSHTTMHNAEEQYYYGCSNATHHHISQASVGNDLIVDWPQCIIDSAADEAATRRDPRKKHRRVTKDTKPKKSVRFSDMSSMQIYTPDTPHSYYYTAKDRKRFSKDALLDAVCIKTHLLMLSRSSPPREEDDEEMFMTMMDIFEPEDIIGIEQFVFCKDWKKYSSAKIRQDHARAVLCAQQALNRDEGEETVSSEDKAKKLCDFASYHSSRSIEEARSRARL